MKQYIRKADIILLIFLILVGIAASAALSFSRVDAGADAKVIIESGGELYATYSLSEDRTVEVRDLTQRRKHRMSAQQAGRPYRRRRIRGRRRL